MTQLDPKALEAAARAVREESEGGARSDATAAITAYLAAMREAGFVLAPVEPNSAMIEAARTMQMPAEYNSPERFALALIANTYRAMIAVAQEGK